jgi:hypothetical protein
VNCWIANPDRVRLTCYTVVADVDIVTASGQTDTCTRTQCDVAVAGDVAKKRKRSSGRVPGAGRVTQKGPSASSRVFVCRVDKERPGPGRCVEVAFSIAPEREQSNSRIVSAGR